MPENRKNIFTKNEILVLITLKAYLEQSENKNKVEVSELRKLSGIKSVDDLTRALYSLEGYKLVHPHPPGDFTSTIWSITPEGLKACELLEDVNLRER